MCDRPRAPGPAQVKVARLVPSPSPSQLHFILIQLNMKCCSGLKVSLQAHFKFVLKTINSLEIFRTKGKTLHFASGGMEEEPEPNSDYYSSLERRA